MTPGRVCSKSSLLVMGGPEPGNMLGDWSAPYSKAKYRKPSQRRRPCRTWSHTLLWSPLQYLSCFTAWIIMSNSYLVKLLFCPFPLLSSLLLDELTVALLPMERYEPRSQNPFSLPVSFFVAFPLFPLLRFLSCVACSLSPGFLREYFLCSSVVAQD